MCLYASHGPAGGGAGQFLALYQHGAGSALRRCPAEQRPPALRSGRANTNTSAPHSQPRGRCLGRGPQPALGASMPGRPQCSRVRGPWAGAEATKRGGRARLPPCRPVRARGRSRAPPAAWAPHRQTALTGQGDGHPPPFPPGAPPPAPGSPLPSLPRPRCVTPDGSRRRPRNHEDAAVATRRSASVVTSAERRGRAQGA